VTGPALLALEYHKSQYVLMALLSPGFVGSRFIAF